MAAFADRLDIFNKKLSLRPIAKQVLLRKYPYCRYFSLIRVPVWANLIFVSTAWLKWLRALKCAS
jgi:hypothetical protein